MADFCLKHTNEEFETNLKKSDVVLSEGFCEDCGKETEIVAKLRLYYKIKESIKDFCSSAKINRYKKNKY